MRARLISSSARSVRVLLRDDAICASWARKIGVKGDDTGVWQA
jgi:hypothetical protein